jgi:hypothetical protein
MMHPYSMCRWQLPFVALLVVQACVDEPPERPADTAPIEDWSVSVGGIGALRVGMTVEEARAALGPGFGPDSTAGCHHAPVEGAPGRVLAMIVDGRVARIEVKDSLVATDRGARIGDDEARIDSLYRGMVTVEPHKYTDGHYLVVTPAAADSGLRLIFETDGSRVTEYRAGRLPEVAWVEGCS